MSDIELNVGDVFLAINLSLCGENPHYHIVVLKIENDKILVVHTTKEVDKVLTRCRLKEKIKFDYIEPDTAVIIDNSASESFTLKSAIDCNKAQLRPISYFTNKPEYKKCAPITDQVIINNIKRGILKSPIVENVIKKLIQ